MDKCLLEDKSWQVDKSLVFGGMFHVQEDAKKSLDNKIMKLA